MSDVYDLAIIGSGFAGLSAAIQATRLQLKTILIDKTIMGGQILNTDLVENYPGFAEGISGIDLITSANKQADIGGLEYGAAEVTGISRAAQPFVVRTDRGPWEARAIIIAAGGERRTLGVPGATELKDRGVSDCATCDGLLYRDQDVAVIGGGDAAMDEALYLGRICRSVHVVSHRSALSGLPVLQERVANAATITPITDTEVVSIDGTTTVTGLSLRNVTTDAMRQLPVTGVFVYIGTDPATDPFKASVPTDSGGHIKVDLRMQTEVPGIFAAGECRWHSTRQLANAAGDGVTAAIAAYDWLQAQDGRG